MKNQTSPYLLQHQGHPVEWYPWCEEAFERAKKEDKPVFLSIGYSTCHWCHVMAHENFEDEEVAKELNRHFISVKVDREERPDIDSIYMTACVLFTGSGGWPASLFLTPDRKPFYAGTYFPRESAYGRIGFLDLLRALHKSWDQDRQKLTESARELIEQMKEVRDTEKSSLSWQHLSLQAVRQFKGSFDEACGGFGDAPKFPMAHNLMFLMEYYQVNRDRRALEMAEKTLMQMYRGGIFDHIGGGFSRYSTDRYFLVPHFEKMLYDNALLLMAYTQAYSVTGKEIYRQVARKTAQYIQREMTDSGGGFYSAQDADSQGEEGKYYVFACEEITSLLGNSAGRKFNEYFNITREGNFEGKSIPNRLHKENSEEIVYSAVGNGGCRLGPNGENAEGTIYSAAGSGGCRLGLNGENAEGTIYSAAGSGGCIHRLNGGNAEEILYCGGGEECSHTEPERLLSKVYAYRRQRYQLFLDDKILTSWNGLMIGAFARMYRIFGQDSYLRQAKSACEFLEKQTGKKDILFVSCRRGRCQGTGFLEDYAFYGLGLIELYGACLEKRYLDLAEHYCGRALELFADKEKGGFFLYGTENEPLIAPSKETYDGAVPSGNSVMAYNLVKLWQITGKEEWRKQAERQLDFLSFFAEQYPAGQSFSLLAALLYQNPPEHIVAVLKEEKDLKKLQKLYGKDADIVALWEETEAYERINNRATLYICREGSCRPPVNL